MPSHRRLFDVCKNEACKNYDQEVNVEEVRMAVPEPVKRLTGPASPKKPSRKAVNCEECGEEMEMGERNV